MARYAALVRGINVGGRSKVSMPDLRAVFEALGYEDVATYIQSGNVVFSGGKVDVAAIERRLADDVGVEASVLVRTAAELAAVASGNPFVKRKLDPATLHVTFLAKVPRGATLDVPDGEPDELTVVGREVYLHCPNGYGRTKVNNAYIEKKLGLAATTRNWRSVLKLAEMTGG